MARKILLRTGGIVSLVVGIIFIIASLIFVQLGLFYVLNISMENVPELVRSFLFNMRDGLVSSSLGNILHFLLNDMIFFFVLGGVGLVANFIICALASVLVKCAGYEPKRFTSKTKTYVFCCFLLFVISALSLTLAILGLGFIYYIKSGLMLLASLLIFVGLFMNKDNSAEDNNVVVLQNNAEATDFVNQQPPQCKEELFAKLRELTVLKQEGKLSQEQYSVLRDKVVKEYGTKTLDN